MQGIRTSVSFVLPITLLTASALVVAAQDDPTFRSAAPSDGCGSSNIEPGRHAGESRFPWELLVPDAHDGVTPVPLVISLHGGMEAAPYGYRRMADVGAEAGFAVIAPQHDRYGAWLYWYEDEALDPSLENPDVASIDELLDELDALLCLDRARIYATGFSGGALGASILGCALEDRIAAIAPVGIGAIGTGAVCALDRAMPTLVVFGKNDPTGPWSGGLSEALLDDMLPSGERWRDTALIKADGFDVSLPVPERVADVAVRNGCEPTPTITPLGEAEHYVWPCPAGGATELVGHDGSHNWSSVTDGRTTGELVWEFLEQHTLPEDWMPAG